MNFRLWDALGLRAARLEDIERECGPFEGERQPPRQSITVVDPERERLRNRQLVEHLRAQEPVERIVNALLFSAIRDGARRLTIEPDERGVRVLLLVGESERPHLHLPSATLAPLVARLRSMAPLVARLRSMAPFSIRVGQERFEMRVQVEERNFVLRVSTQETPWGERVEVAFASGS